MNKLNVNEDLFALAMQLIKNVTFMNVHIKNRFVLNLINYRTT